MPLLCAWRVKACVIFVLSLMDPEPARHLRKKQKVGPRANGTRSEAGTIALTVRILSRLNTRNAYAIKHQNSD